MTAADREALTEALREGEPWPGAPRPEVIAERIWPVVQRLCDQRAAQQAVELRDVLRVHHPIMRSETGPFSGCRCGQVKLGQDVIAHVVVELRAALRARADQAQP